MTRFSFNPYIKIGSRLSPQSLRELIIAQQRRIKEISDSILQAEWYLSKTPESQPTIFRLDALKKERIRVSRDLTKAKHRLTKLLKRIAAKQDSEIEEKGAI